MPIHDLTRSASEWNLASQHGPERYAKRVQIRADVDRDSSELLGTGKLWCPSKSPRCGNRGGGARLIEQLGQAQVDEFCRYRGFLPKAHHDVARLDVPVHQLLFVHRTQTSGDLRGN